MIVLFGIVIIVYFAVNYYIIRRGLQAMPTVKTVRAAYLSLSVLLSLSYMAGRLFERFDWTGPAEIFIVAGAFWFAAVLYFFLLILLVDFLRAIDRIFPFFPEFIRKNPRTSKRIAFYAITGLTVTILFFGFINAREPVIKNVHLRVHKNVNGMKTLRMTVVSDIHIGVINGKNFAEGLVRSLKRLNPDIILLPGDILDETTNRIIEQAPGEPFKSLHPKYGVWAVTGNHEYFGGVANAINFFRHSGIRLLRDKAIKIDNKFYLAGRDDRSKDRFGGEKRKSLAEVLHGVDKSFPVILLDHQPIGLGEARENGVDLQISGHTHHGQLWPLNIITNIVYELSWGYMQKGGTHYYVSSGYGTWGPPVRTGNTPEIVIITITFD